MDQNTDEKFGLLFNEEVEAQYATDPEYRSTPLQSYHRSLIKRRVVCLAIITFGLLLFFHPYYSNFFRPLCTHSMRADERFLQSIAGNDSLRVPLEAHIMSKCPDAKDCLRDLVVPAMEKVYDKVDFKLSYIGTYVISHFTLVRTR